MRFSVCSPLVVAVLALSAAACTRVVDSPAPQAEPPVAPITAGQIGDLLSPKVDKTDGNLFVTVEPPDCAGVAREVDPPFIADYHPAAYDGGHWMTDISGREVYVEEMVGVYRSDYNAKDALAQAKSTIESCRGRTFWVTSMAEREYAFQLLPAIESSAPEIVLWSFSGDNWACDSAFVAAYNAAIEISTCGPANGYDVATLAEEALERIRTLANTAA
ncbi:sensor domain-containing protein [Mycolicibacterium flavescens]|uniref:PknH-like domain protein n=1 Tax=Mycolicibacterium flavescens TaxID=1776 RepID=A0A1E3RJX1_MYCFV|nr:sensor domain-containing protein [Mycolicibacterium flavescens]MCV7282537.1 sensor domain-containing protein [Mycolicibacterium flavescens]ODQ90163.1 pknH-like domain protein [Mycolicibacterium flavescens]